MKRIIKILFFLLILASTSQAKQYILKSGMILCRVDINAQEDTIWPGETIPNENVYVRLHPEINNPTFVVKPIDGGEGIPCCCPSQSQSWPLKDCFYAKCTDRLQDTPAFIIEKGDSEQPGSSKFHYFFVLVGEFDDVHFSTLPYNSVGIDSLEKTIHQAINALDGRSIGTRNILTNKQTRYDTITNKMTTIMDDVQKGDYVLLYFSSHGVREENGQFYLITKDTYKDSNSESYQNVLSRNYINDYVNQLTGKGGRVLLFVDACNAGAILDENVNGEAAYFLSSTDNEHSMQYGNQLVWSPFAEALIRVMNGTAGNDNTDCNKHEYNYFREKIVYVDSLGKYLQKTIGCQLFQTPIYNSHGFVKARALWKFPSFSADSMAIYKQLARNGDKEAMIKLGDYYYEGCGTGVYNYMEAKKWYENASNSKEKVIRAKALLKLSIFYGNEPNCQEIKSYEYASQSAKLGNGDAMYRLSQYYRDGKGCRKDEQKRLYWLKKASTAGNADARKCIRTYSDSNDEVYIFADCASRVQLPIVSPKYQYMMGLYYYKGKVIQQDYKKAVEWFTKAANRNFAPAQNSLGICTYYGYGMNNMNHTKAFQLFLQAAKQGEEAAQNNVGNCYLNGIGLWEAQPDSAIYWYKKAAEQGCADAQYNLGTCYYDGIGVDADVDTALKWYIQAAGQGHKQAQQALIDYYEREGNIRKAEFWRKINAKTY